MDLVEDGGELMYAIMYGVMCIAFYELMCIAFYELTYANMYGVMMF